MSTPLTDLIARLRDPVNNWNSGGRFEAADAIERLASERTDMLAALKHAAGKIADLEYHWIGDKADLWGPISAVIAKAEGR